MGHDLSHADWAAAVEQALREFPTHPHLLQRFHKPGRFAAQYWDPSSASLQQMDGRVRLCPYYFLHGSGDSARPQLGGALATICPPEKKIIHGMKDAILAPCTT